MKRFFGIVLLVMIGVVVCGSMVYAAAPVEIGSSTNSGLSYSCSAVNKKSSEMWVESGATKLCYEGEVYTCGSATVGKRYVDSDAFGIFCSKDIKGKYVWQVCGSGLSVDKFSSYPVLATLALNNQVVGEYTCKKKEYSKEYWVETKSLGLFQGTCGELDNNEVISGTSETKLCTMSVIQTCDSATVGKIKSEGLTSLLCSSSLSWNVCGKNSFFGTGFSSFLKDDVVYVGSGVSYQGFYCDGSTWQKTQMYDVVGKSVVMRVKHSKSNALLCSGSGAFEVCSMPTFTKENSDSFILGGSDISYFWTTLRVWEVQGGNVVIELPSSTKGEFSSKSGKGEGMMTLCSSSVADSGYVSKCDGIRDDVSLSSIWKEVDLGSGQFTLQHVKSGQYLCASSNGKSSNTVGKCANKNRDDVEWSTKFVRVDEDCVNGVDDDSDGLVDCSDDMCYMHLECKNLWEGKRYLAHPKSGQYLCANADGKVEMCEYANRKKDDVWQTEWNLILKTKGMRNYFLVEDVNHKNLGSILKGIAIPFSSWLCFFTGKGTGLPVIGCAQESMSDRDASVRLSFKQIATISSRNVEEKKWEVYVEPRALGNYLCAEGVKGKYGVNFCSDIKKDDLLWSTRWVLEPVPVENCVNGKDDDLDDEIDCKDSDCAQDVKCKVVCTGGTKCGGMGAKGLLDEMVCGTDFQNYRCMSSGWVGQGDNCKQCPYPEVLCDNNEDDDGDGLQDCKDSDCFADEKCKDMLCSGCMEDCLLKKDKAGVLKWMCVECDVDLQCSGGKKCINYKCDFPPETNSVTCVDSDVANDIHVKGGVTLLQGGKVVGSEEDSCVGVDVLKEMKCGLIQGKAFIDYDAKECLELPEKEYCLKGMCQKGLVLGTLGGSCDEKTVCPEGAVCDVVKGKPELGKICLGGNGGTCANSLFCAQGFVCKNNKCVDATTFKGEAICDDGIDNDKDGKIDCVDPDCDDETNGKGFVCCGGVAGKDGVDATPCVAGTICDDEGLDGSFQCVECSPGEKECAKGSCVQGKCIFCDDSDGDNGYGVKGKVTVGSVSVWDECVNDKVLKEYFCIGEIPAIGINEPGVNFKDFIDLDEIDCVQQGGSCVDGKCVGKNFCADTYEKVGKKVGKEKSIIEKFLKLFTKGKYAGCLKGDFNSDGVIDADDSTDYVLAFRNAGQGKGVDEKANLDEDVGNKIDASDTTDYVLAFRNYGKLKK